MMARFRLCAFAILAAIGAAQTYGGGLGKTTYSASDGFGCSQWMLTYLPTQHDMPNGATACGEVGRVRIATAAVPAGTCVLQRGAVTLSNATDANTPQLACVKSPSAPSACEYTVGAAAVGANATGSSTAASTPAACCAACAADADCTGATYTAGASAGFTQGFGLHAVHVLPSSPRPAGSTTNRDVEAVLDAKLAAVHAGGGYDAFLDFTSGHWVSSLDPYTTTFDAVGIPYVLLQWNSAGGAAPSPAYYSLIVRVHTSMMLIEMMSEQCAACTAPGAHVLAAPSARYHFAQGQTPASVFGALTDATAARPLFHPARVSWPTSSLARDRKFFVDAKVANVLAQVQNGPVSTDVYDFTTFAAVATMQFHLVQRPASNTTGSFAIADFEEAMLSAHEATMTSDVCGFDQWVDNHIGISARGGGGGGGDDDEASPAAAAGAGAGAAVTPGNWTIGRFQTVLEQLGLRYHVLVGYTGTVHNVYASAPNGLVMQVSGMADGNYVPSMPLGNGSLSLCTMGSASCGHATTLAS
eukprot:g4580.t1